MPMPEVKKQPPRPYPLVQSVSVDAAVEVELGDQMVLLPLRAAAVAMKFTLERAGNDVSALRATEIEPVVPELPVRASVPRRVNVLDAPAAITRSCVFVVESKFTVTLVPAALIVELVDAETLPFGPEKVGRVKVADVVPIVKTSLLSCTSPFASAVTVRVRRSFTPLLAVAPVVE